MSAILQILYSEEKASYLNRLYASINDYTSSAINNLHTCSISLILLPSNDSSSTNNNHPRSS